MNAPHPLVSVIINTNGKRKTKLIACIHSIEANTYHPIEIIVVQQADKQIGLGSNIQTFQVAKRGAGYAKNKGIASALGEVIVFTDDDCIVKKNWIVNIIQVFKRHPNASAVFGRVLPYKKTWKKNTICPSIIIKITRGVFTAPTYHDDIGSGNNMAILKTALSGFDGFKEWLGPGSVGRNCDDAEIILRLLTTKHMVVYDPRPVVYHDRWIDKDELQKQNRDYLHGEIACYFFYAMRGYGFAWRRLLGRTGVFLWRLKHLVKLFIVRDHPLDWLLLCIREASDIFRGIFVGGWYSIKELVS